MIGGMDVEAKLNELRALPTETEWLEFKQNDLGPAKYANIGEYVSAIANSLVLCGREMGYIAWGVSNSTHELVGTDFRPRLAKVGNEELENWLVRNLDPQVRHYWYETDINGRHFTLLAITPATYAPVEFAGQRFIRVGSLKKKLNDHREKERELWDKLTAAVSRDWSATVIEGATLDDLDPVAILKARGEYKNKNPKIAAAVDNWSDAAFLNKAKVTIGGKITRTAVVLLGREESEHFLSPSLAKISWILKDSSGAEKDYEHFGPPLLVNVDRVFSRIRNLTHRYLKINDLFPTEVTQYDPWVIREALHNCIAHQDYSLRGRVSVVEQDEGLLFTNLGQFIPETVERVITDDAPPDIYRNPFLAAAMVNLNMIDTIGSGVRRMFEKQRGRCFPMPDYDLSELKRVKVHVLGKVLDENYTRALMAQTDLPLVDVIALDRVQKRLSVSDDQLRSLRQRGLVEGRRPNVVVSAGVAALTDTRAEYIGRRALDKQHYKALVTEYLRKFQPAAKRDIERLLIEKLSTSLGDAQKRNFIRNLLQEMRREGAIKPDRQRYGAMWELATGADKAAG